MLFSDYNKEKDESLRKEKRQKTKGKR